MFIMEIFRKFLETRLGKRMQMIWHATKRRREIWGDAVLRERRACIIIAYMRLDFNIRGTKIQLYTFLKKAKYMHACMPTS